MVCSDTMAQGKALVFGKEVSKHKKECFEKIGVQLQSSNYQAAIRVREACEERAALCSVGICCSAFMSIPILMVDYRDKKVLKSFYCSPCSPAALLGADTLCSAVMCAISALLVAVAAVFGFGYRMEGNVFGFISSWLLTLVSMFSIGLLAASLCRTVKSMNVATSLLYFPMLLFSGATIPYEVFPKGMQRIADFMPLSQGIQLMKAVSAGTEVNMTGIVVLVVIAILCTGIAVKTFRWE